MNLNIFEQNFRGRHFMAEKRNFSQHSRKFSAINPRARKLPIWSILDVSGPFGVKIAILSSNLNDFDQPDMSNRF